ncbi:MAG: dTDP-4-amino-4,6-dideoxygalactose transaminase [Planctomycetota bacterium]|jgi:dTDP-4-amino-4,6-dideoxygalactose transaminase
MKTPNSIPFNIPYLCGDENAAIQSALESRAHCGNFAYSQKCIELLIDRYKFSSVFLTPSCTSALEMGAILCDLKPGDEVIMPSYTFSSTANAVVLRGAKPVFCDVTSSTMNIDVDLIEGLITGKTKMILPIDYAGIPCDIEAINAIAGKHNLLVMQDAAQSIHSYHLNGNACGSEAALAAFSFHESKNIGCGEGGALIVNSKELIERANILQEKGTDRHKVLAGMKNKYSWVDVGSSFLLSDILAAMLYVQLNHTEEIVNKRKKIVDAYKSIFSKYEKAACLQLPSPPTGLKLNYHAYFVIFDTEENRTLFLAGLREKNIHAYIGYVPLHSSPYGKQLGYEKQDVPLTEELSGRIVRLPMYPDLAEENTLNYCIDNIGLTLETIYGSY